MKKRRNKGIETLTHSEARTGVEAVHFRLCHVCLHLNESAQEIFNCEKCQRPLTVELLVEEKLRQRRVQVQDEEDLEGEMREHSGLYGLVCVF